MTEFAFNFSGLFFDHDLIKVFQVTMKAIPAHSKEADIMADALLRELSDFGFRLNMNGSGPGNASLGSTNINDVREALSIIMGWGTWTEMCEYIRNPHAPVYFDDHPQLFDIALSKLSQLVGIGYSHGSLRNILTNSGVGFSPNARRELEANKSPWGDIYERTVIDDGIEVVCTHSHGGIVLSDERQAQMPPHLSNGTAFYEEDCEVNLVYLSFPNAFKDKLGHALGSYPISLIDPNSIPQKREFHSVEHEEMLKSILSNTLTFSNSGEMLTVDTYVAPEDDPLNREFTDAENEAIIYIAKCVYLNRAPVKIPDNKAMPTLADWVCAFESALRVDGQLPILGKKWKEHFFCLVEY